METKHFDEGDEVAELRRLLQSARSAFRTLHLALVETTHLALYRNTILRVADRSATGDVAAIVEPGVDEQDAAAGQRSFRREIWWRPPDRWRDDVHIEAGAVVTTAIVGLRWTQVGTPPIATVRSIVPRRIARAMAKLPRHNAWRSDGSLTIDSRLREVPLIATPEQIASWDLAISGRTEHCRRLVRRVSATAPADGDSSAKFDVFAAMHWLVDAPSGILLRSAAIDNGAEVVVREVVACEFDQPIPDSVFSIEHGET